MRTAKTADLPQPRGSPAPPGDGMQGGGLSHGHVPPPQGHGRPRPRTEAPSRGKVCPELLQLQEWDAWALLSTLPGAAIPAARAQLAHEEPHKWLQQITKEYPDAVAQYLERKRLSNGDAAVNRGLQALENAKLAGNEDLPAGILRKILGSDAFKTSVS